MAEEELRGLALTAGGKWEEREGAAAHGRMMDGGGMGGGGMDGGGMDGGGMNGAMMDALLEAYDAGGAMLHGEAMMMDGGMGVAGMGMMGGDGMAGVQCTQQVMEGAQAAARAMWMGASHATCRAAIGGSSSATMVVHGAGSMGRGGAHAGGVGAHGGGVGAHAWAVERAIREGLRPHASTSFKTAARFDFLPTLPAHYAPHRTAHFLGISFC
ncbi:unnamed protein product [Closterium sp. Yama58-4]|nr:unnamed protein product [Closterium sp. Yama58-4]